MYQQLYMHEQRHTQTKDTKNRTRDEPKDEIQKE